MSSFIVKLAITATALSVAVMVLAVAIISGFKYEIREKIFSFWGHVIVADYSQNRSDLLVNEPLLYDSFLVQRIQQMPQVTQINPFIIRPAIIKTATDMEGIKLKGVSGNYQIPAAIRLSGKPIDFSDTSYAKEIILSQTTADKLNVKTGEDIQLYFIERGQAVPRIRKVKIAGIFHTGMDEVDKAYAVCDIRMLQRINQWQPDEINGYQIDLKNEGYMQPTADTIYQHYIGPPLYAYTMKEIYINIFDWLQLQNMNAQIVIIIMAIIAIINLAVAILMLIVEHAKMVGVLKSLGMSFRQIMRIFINYSIMIAGLGVLIGNIIALVFYWLQSRYGLISLNEETYYMTKVPVRMRWEYLAIIDIATLVVCVLCMWLPTLYIRKIQPVKVLQFK